MGCTTAATPESEARDSPIVQSWSFDYPVAQLGRLPEEQRHAHVGYIGDAARFAAIWRAAKPTDPVPQVDFDKNLVLFARNIDFYNRTSIAKVTLVGGSAEVIAIETMSALPIEDKVAMALAEVPRAGVSTLRSGDKAVAVLPP
jgi:hypothetical protein